MDEDRTRLPSFFPRGRDAPAVSCGVIEGLRKNKDPANLLRVVPIHPGCGPSLRALSGPCACRCSANRASRYRAGPASRCGPSTPRRSGARQDRRLPCSIALPALVCDHFRITSTEGKGTGETFRQFPVAARGGGHVTVRINTGSPGLVARDGSPFGLGAALSSPDRIGSAGWPARPRNRKPSSVPDA